MAALLLALLSILSGGDPSEDLPRSMSLSEPRTEASKWVFDVAPYGWLTSVAGTAQIGALSVTTSAKFSDLFHNLKFAAAVHGEAWHDDKIGILVDTFWVKTEVDATTLTGGTASLTTWLGLNEIDLAVRTKVDVVRFDFLAGVRWVYVSNDIDTTAGLGASKHRNYLDPVFGARFGGDPWDWLELWLRVDAGGFGIGTDLTGSITAGANFRVSNVIGIVAAYKAMGIKIEESNHSVDLRFQGPVIGIDFRF
jgi:hypothetical protein